MQSIAYIPGSNGAGNASQMTVQNVRAPGASDILVNTVSGVSTKFFASMGAPHTFTDPVTGETITIISEATAVDFAGHVDSGKLVIDAIAPGYVDTRGSLVGDIVVVRPTTEWANNIFNILNADHNDTGTHKDNTINPTGTVVDFAGIVAPAGWLLTYGQAVSRATYASLFNLLNPTLGTATISISSPGLVGFTAHGMKTGDAVYFTTTGALPTGVSANTQYFAIVMDANSFRLATSFANALAGTAINTTGSQSGVHTLRRSPFGVGDGTTTFNVPDLRGRAIAGNDQMGGVSANRLTNATGSLDGDVLGAAGGVESHNHRHASPVGYTSTSPRLIRDGEYQTFNASVGASASAAVVTTTFQNDGTGLTGAGLEWYTITSSSNSSVQPTLIMNKIIKT